MGRSSPDGRPTAVLPADDRPPSDDSPAVALPLPVPVGDQHRPPGEGAGDEPPVREPDLALVGADGWESPAGYDGPRVERAVRELLIAIGEDPDRDGLRGTPARVARSMAELTVGMRQRADDVLATTFDAGHDELVVVRDIDVWSLCEHHLLPFTGTAHVGYIPGPHGRVTGLSKLARLVDVYARRPQLQERLTTQVAEALVRVLRPRGVLVVVECEHLCLSMRGVAKAGSTTVTSAVRGALRDPATRAEAMSLMTRR